MNGISYNKRELLNQPSIGEIGFLWCDPENTLNSYQFGQSIVIHNNQTCIINDFGNDSVPCTTVLNYLQSNNIKKVDAVIISHYHGDHVRVDAVRNLLNSSVDTSETVFFLPHKYIDWKRGYGDTATDMQNICEGIHTLLQQSNLQIIEPTEEGWSTTIGNIELSFWNVDTTFFEDYYDWKWKSHDGSLVSSPRYNNFSMVVNARIKGTNILLTGDIENPAQKNIDGKVISNADVMLIPHHAVNMNDNRYFSNLISSKIAVAMPYSYLSYPQLNNAISLITKKCLESGSVVTTESGSVSITLTKEGPICNQSGGSITGVYIGNVIQDGEDMNDLDFGLSFLNGSNESTIINLPDNATLSSLIYTLPLNGTSSDNYDTKIQIAFTPTDSYTKLGRIQFRRRYYDTNLKKLVWSEWRRTDFPFPVSHEATEYIGHSDGRNVDIFWFGDNNRLSPKILRGDVGDFGVDLNDIKVGGQFATGIGDQVIHTPTDESKVAYYMQIFSRKNASGRRRCIQIATPYNATRSTDDKFNHVYIRQYQEESATQWTDWYQLPRLKPLGTSEIPDPPSVDGEYSLKATVATGTVTYSWIKTT